MPSHALSNLNSLLSKVTVHTTPRGQLAGQKARSQVISTIKNRRPSKQLKNTSQLKKRSRRRHRKSHINKQKKKTRADYKNEKERMLHARNFLGKRGH